ncbi:MULTISPECIES: hypothetical protein [unclassified Streptomyces]|uniref:hypothetical protein n=1 Tax=unclassified Streptomyces TaxID=2593676 RepID=UPI000F6DD4D3|nr:MULTISPECIES: hypothetical protein [unclassified Streptomyces]AZM61729.1 hypothetical protein DLM49_21205 [Streptomyces sp. WAC 01438]RSN02182.1 hypothetical protein DMA10_00360 [Streptomyces sp. WAC 01420]
MAAFLMGVKSMSVVRVVSSAVTARGGSTPWARPGPPPFDLEARLLGLADLVLHGAIRPAAPR